MSTAPLSIVIATYNRCNLLEETLDSLLSLFEKQLIESRSEVIIIDNNSSDNTHEVGEKFSLLYPFIRYYKETRQGLSFARNKGITEAKNELIVFVDDDVVFKEDWIEKITLPFSDYQTGMAGGKMLPYNISVPPWVPSKYYFLLGVIDFGNRMKEVSQTSGGNIIVRKSVLEKIGLFNVNLGRKGNKLLGGEEVELSMRIKKNGFKIIYNPEAVVFHKIENKINEKYINDCVFLCGASQANIDKRWNKIKFIIKRVYSFLYTKIKAKESNTTCFNEERLRYKYLSGYLM